MKRLLLIAVALGMIFSAATASAGKIEEIKDRGVLVAGVKDSVVPFGFVDENSKQLVGFDVDICRYIAGQLGVELELKTVTSATRIPMVTQGSVDIAAATMTHKHERDNVIDFSITYFMDGQKILVAKDSGINSVADLKGKKVATVKGSTSEKNIKAAQPDCRVLSFDEYPQAMLALKQGKASAVTTDSTILLGLKNSDPEPEKWVIAGDYISAEPYGLGLPENDSDFRDFVNKALNDMWRSGEYEKVYNKWFGPDSRYYLPLTWTMELWPN
ncbi:ABC-type transporter, periplasmic subunit family 3 [Oleidesulfovibrio alaskensis G20]|jgi:polar amino acid transport system substrate-binding protein|uniref:ABC-type transporter, periplasmic subunit family 3 n=1 Tax=Oleidesulfovibrio alaskensis (strain ATCC BAA-1058 / DSM 17464 / G20) TaxID=207559 RepID=Q312B8_OLEA2|nr:ABC transporter substrate-binding protein [Oleidesulfovibrio alaskensis]ABB38228.1 ABC-type transporter, periplasmic subunit family 3 [Oleidesulfovibrio alaskensis G20]MBG0774436.1 ABC transporter substrate-binding protein [Oleidesulfovibrio alaskensis]MBL3581169.1 ABC transporter substrate-binding protein [Oleidesulfovibrio alaskensis]